MRASSFFIIFTLNVIGCSSIPKSQLASIQFEKVELGATATKIIESFGPPKKNKEEFQSSRFEVFEYFTPSGQPSAFFTIDSYQRVVGRSIWVESSDKKSQLENLINGEFKDIKFKRYIPCETWGNDVVLANRDLGIMIATRNQSVLLVSKSQQPLTDLRIGQFYKKCPQLQSEPNEFK